MRISDWSSDVCSSDLPLLRPTPLPLRPTLLLHRPTPLPLRPKKPSKSLPFGASTERKKDGLPSGRPSFFVRRLQDYADEGARPHPIAAQIGKKRRLKKDRKMKMVGETGFEPATSCSQSKRATGLRHSPTLRAL